MDPARHSSDPGFAPVSEDQRDKRQTEAITKRRERESSEGGLYLGSGVKHTMESGPSQGGNSVRGEKVDLVNPLPSTLSMGPESMQIVGYSTLYL